MNLQFQVIVHNCREVTMARTWDCHILSRAEGNARMHNHLLTPSSVYLPIQLRTPCLRNDATHSEMELSTSINIQTSPSDRPTGPANLSQRLSSQMILSCVKLTIKADRHCLPVTLGFVSSFGWQSLPAETFTPGHFWFCLGKADTGQRLVCSKKRYCVFA